MRMESCSNPPGYDPRTGRLNDAGIQLTSPGAHELFGSVFGSCEETCDAAASRIGRECPQAVEGSGLVAVRSRARREYFWFRRR